MKPIVLIATELTISLSALSYHYPTFNPLTRYFHPSLLNSFAKSRIKLIGRRFGYLFSLYSYLAPFSSGLRYSHHYRPGHFWQFERLLLLRFRGITCPACRPLSEIASLHESASRAISHGTRSRRLISMCLFPSCLITSRRGGTRFHPYLPHDTEASASS